MIDEFIAGNSHRYRHEKGGAAAKGIPVANTVQRKDPFTFLNGTKKDKWKTTANCVIN